MASVTKRGDRWQARYRERPGGPQRYKTFALKKDAQRWLDDTTAALVTGAYVQPGAGRVTFREYAEQWRAVQVHRPTTARHVAGALNRHIYPVIGGRALEQIRPSDLQAMVKGLDLSPSTVRVTWRYVSAIFKAAVLDRRIPVSPCQGVRLPKTDQQPVQVVSTESVRALLDEIPERMQAMLVLAAGTGMRQGEIFGLTTDRVDFLRRTARVDRQMLEGGTFGPPKTSSSVRTIPLPQTVIDALAVHLQTFPAGEQGLIFTRPSGAPWTRGAFSERWVNARKAAGLPDDVTMHSLRHYYASLLIRHGESVKVVQSRLGHATAVETLDTYSHLWPDSEDRTRDAVDAVLGADGGLSAARMLSAD